MEPSQSDIINYLAALDSTDFFNLLGTLVTTVQGPINAQKVVSLNNQLTSAQTQVINIQAEISALQGS